MTHELSLMADLVRKVLTVATEEEAVAVVRVAVRLGALSHMSPEHFREHWEQAARGTIAEGAAIDIEVGDDSRDPHGQDIWLSSVELAFG